jgi:hypothetical protein
MTTAARKPAIHLAHRWPTLLALLLTVDNWIDPGVPRWWVLILLGGEYLVIGTIRNAWTDRRTLRLTVLGFVVYVALAILATVAGPTAGGILIAVGWLGHAGWDGLLWHRNIVTWRWYAEACLVIDLVIGLTTLVFVLTRSV